MMKKFALWSLALLLTFAAACSDYDDTELWNSVNDIKKRVEALETAVAKLNSDVSAMQTLIEKLNEKVYVSKVETNADGSYTIYFTDPENTKITITNGKDGAAAPVIGVAKDTDEIYYWTLTSGGGEPEWLLADGKKIPVTAAAVVPLLKIDDKGFWIISCDKGATWNYITDDKDQPVSALGQGGVSDSFFKEVTQDGAYAYFTLMDGTTITVAMRSDFYLLVKMAPALGTYAYGENKTYETESVGVNDVVLTKPTGWVVSYADEVLTIKAPAEEAVCETEGEIAVIYFGDNDRSSLVKMKVKIDKDYTGVTEGDNFTLEITEVGDTRVRAAITPKDPEMSYYVYPYDPAKSDEACITQLQKRFKADIADGPEYVDYFFKGTKTDYRYSGLTPGESYDLSVVGVKYDLTAKTLDIVTPLMRVPFSTKAPEIINTAYLMTLSDISWYGAKCAVHPSDDLPYFCTFVKKSTFDMAYDDADFAQTYIDDRYLWPYSGELSDRNGRPRILLAGIRAARSALYLGGYLPAGIRHRLLRRGVRLQRERRILEQPRLAQAFPYQSLHADRSVHLHHRRNRRPTGPRHQGDPVGQKHELHHVHRRARHLPRQFRHAAAISALRPLLAYAGTGSGTDDRGRRLLLHGRRGL